MIVRLGRFPLAALAAVAVTALLIPSCGGGPPSALPPPTTPAPSPTPPPPTGGGAASCSIGPGSQSSECSRASSRGGSSRLLPSVEDAINLLVEQKPQLFDLNDEHSPGSKAYRVLDREAYFDGVVANLRAAGLCAERDVDDLLQQTIRVKSANDFSEDFDLILETGYMRRGGGAYRQTCTPAAFPVERDPDSPPIGSGCGRPFPPPISRMNCKVHLKGSEYDTLDSTALVGPDIEYCASAGFTDGRSLCPVRPNGAPDREACENWRVGNATDTGRPGPTWRKEDGSFCTGSESGCANSPSNQFQLYAYSSGTYTVCAQTGTCCTVVVER